MNLLTLITDIEIYRSYSRKPIEIPAGEYYLHPKLANYIAETYPFHAETRQWDTVMCHVKDSDTGKRVLLICPAGIGDTIFVLPTAEVIKKMGNEVTLAVPTAMMPLIPKSYYDTLVAVESLPFDFVMRHDRIISFDKTLSPNHDLTQFQGAVVHAGLSKYTSLIKPTLIKPDLDTHKNWQAEISFFAAKIAVLQYSASSPVKSVPKEKLDGIVFELIKDRYRVWITDRRDKEKEVERIQKSFYGALGLVNFAALSEDVSDLAFLISRADLVIAPDSAAIHLAGCYGVPCVGIFSPFPPAETAYIYPSVKPVFVRDDCKFRDPKYGGCYTYGTKPCPAAQEQGREDSPCWDNLDIREVVEVYHSLTLDKK